MSGCLFVEGERKLLTIFPSLLLIGCLTDMYLSTYPLPSFIFGDKVLLGGLADLELTVYTRLLLNFLSASESWDCSLALPHLALAKYLLKDSVLLCVGFLVPNVVLNAFCTILG